MRRNDGKAVRSAIVEQMVERARVDETRERQVAALEALGRAAEERARDAAATIRRRIEEATRAQLVETGASTMLRALSPAPVHDEELLARVNRLRLDVERGALAALEDADALRVLHQHTERVLREYQRVTQSIEELRGSLVSAERDAAASLDALLAERRALELRLQEEFDGAVEALARPLEEEEGAQLAREWGLHVRQAVVDALAGVETELEAERSATYLAVQRVVAEALRGSEEVLRPLLLRADAAILNAERHVLRSAEELLVVADEWDRRSLRQGSEEESDPEATLSASVRTPSPRPGASRAQIELVALREDTLDGWEALSTTPPERVVDFLLDMHALAALTDPEDHARLKAAYEEEAGFVARSPPASMAEELRRPFGSHPRARAPAMAARAESGAGRVERRADTMRAQLDALVEAATTVPPLREFGSRKPLRPGATSRSEPRERALSSSGAFQAPPTAKQVTEAEERAKAAIPVDIFLPAAARFSSPARARLLYAEPLDPDATFTRTRPVPPIAIPRSPPPLSSSSPPRGRAPSGVADESLGSATPRSRSGFFAATIAPLAGTSHSFASSVEGARTRASSFVAAATTESHAAHIASLQTEIRDLQRSVEASSRDLLQVFHKLLNPSWRPPELSDDATFLQVKPDPGSITTDRIPSSAIYVPRPAPVVLHVAEPEELRRRAAENIPPSVVTAALRRAAEREAEALAARAAAAAAAATAAASRARSQRRPRGRARGGGGGDDGGASVGGFSGSGLSTGTGGLRAGRGPRMSRAGGAGEGAGVPRPPPTG